MRTLTDDDRSSLQRLLAAYPVVACGLIARLDAAGSLHPARLGGVVLGSSMPGGELVAACFIGGSVVPVGEDPVHAHALGAAVAGRQRAASEVVGEAHVVAAFWSGLAPVWGRPRSLRWNQPLLWSDRAAPVTPDRRVRMALLSDLDQYLPAATAMFTEELGIPPHPLGGADGYQSRLAAMVASGRAYLLADERGRVVFKAEIGAVSRHTAQLQGVWVHPQLRGQGVGTAAMATVIEKALRLAPAVSLYVNDYNLPARALYAKLGLRQVGTLATLLF